MPVVYRFAFRPPLCLSPSLTSTRIVPRRTKRTRCRLVSYNPEADIFSNDFAVDEPTVEEPDTSIDKKRVLRHGSGDIAELIDMGDLEQFRISQDVANLKELNRKRLVCICRSYGLTSEGRKHDLVLRILHYEKTHTEQSCWRTGVPSIKELLPA